MVDNPEDITRAKHKGRPTSACLRGNKRSNIVRRCLEGIKNAGRSYVKRVRKLFCVSELSAVLEWKDVQFGSLPKDFEQKREKKRKEQKMYWIRCPLKVAI